MTTGWLQTEVRLVALRVRETSITHLAHARVANEQEFEQIIVSFRHVGKETVNSDELLWAVETLRGLLNRLKFEQGVGGR